MSSPYRDMCVSCVTKSEKILQLESTIEGFQMSEKTKRLGFILNLTLLIFSFALTAVTSTLAVAVPYWGYTNNTGYMAIIWTMLPIIVLGTVAILGIILFAKFGDRLGLWNG